MRYAFIVWSFLVAFTLSSVSTAEEARQIPLLLNYQSTLFDEGGNLLQDGSTDFSFRIVGPDGNILYEENQQLDVLEGRVSAIIGNGLSGGGAATGGVPSDIFDPKNQLFLQVEIPGQKPYDNLEIVSVPYSLWSEKAISLTEGSLKGEMIGEGVIQKSHLSDELISYIENNNMLGNYVNSVQGSMGASKVGVGSTFIYSGSSTVQGVLKDLDIAVRRRQEEVDWAKGDYTAKVANEALARQNTDTSLQTQITDGRSSVSAEVIARQNADSSLQTQITDGRSSVSAEVIARQNADSSLQSQIMSHTGSGSAHGSDGAVVGMNTLNAQLAAIQGPVGDISQQLTSFARLETGSYVGSFSGGIDDGQHIHVGFRPKFLVVSTSNDDGTNGSWGLFADMVSPTDVHYTQIITKGEGSFPAIGGVAIDSNGFVAKGAYANGANSVYSWFAIGK